MNQWGKSILTPIMSKTHWKGGIRSCSDAGLRISEDVQENPFICIYIRFRRKALKWCPGTETACFIHFTHWWWRRAKYSSVWVGVVKAGGSEGGASAPDPEHQIPPPPTWAVEPDEPQVDVLVTSYGCPSSGNGALVWGGVTTFLHRGRWAHLEWILNVWSFDSRLHKSRSALWFLTQICSCSNRGLKSRWTHWPVSSLYN